MSNDSGKINTDSGATNTDSETTLDMRLQEGRILDERWEIIKHFASGGKGDIYLARQLNLNREVAIKLISPDFVQSLRDDPEELETEKERFRREVLVMASIQHPNILQVYDNGTLDIDGEELDYLVMEYVPGKTLRATMKKEGFLGDQTKILAWLKNYYMPILEGVETCHEAGIIHRDLKPENVLMAGDTPKITDFGLARGEHLDKNLTHTAHILGTIFYMPKEQFEDGASTDRKADIYALGKILYEAICGKITNASKVVFKEVGLDPEQDKAFNSSFYKKLNALIRKATKEEHDERMDSVGELRRALGEILDELSLPQALQKERKLLRYGVVGLLLLVCALFLLHWVHPFSFLSKEKTIDLHSQDGQPAMVDDGEGGLYHYVQGGLAQWLDGPKKPERSEEMPSFYIRTSMVNNAQYVNFLNKKLTELSIRDEMVFHNDDMWIKLGLVREDYEPIKLVEGKFALSNKAFANAEVVNVSLEGAMAFANFYNQKLPRVGQWQRAKSLGAIPLKASTSDQEILGEWMCDLDQNNMTHFIVKPTKEDFELGDFPLPRESWEAFPDIGFRTIMEP